MSLAAHGSGSLSLPPLQAPSLHPQNASEAEQGGVSRKRTRWVDKEWNTKAFGSLSISRFLARKYAVRTAVILVILVALILMSCYHDTIVEWVEPHAEKVRDWPAGWVIFVAVMFVLSFPPLLGHEIVAIVAGIVYGLWIGFAIVAAGTLVGESAAFFACKSVCAGCVKRKQEEDVTFDCLGRVFQKGGFKIIILARLSLLPGHLVTMVVSTCGISFWTFFFTAAITLPKQLQVVYLGVIFNNTTQTPTDKAISYSALALSFAVTVGAFWYMVVQMGKERPTVQKESDERSLRRREKADAKKGRKEAGTFAPSGPNSTNSTVNLAGQPEKSLPPAAPSLKPGSLASGAAMASLASLGSTRQDAYQQ